MRLLVVDDDPKFRAYIRRGLEESGIDCEVAAGPRAAEEILAGGQEHGIDLILLDVMMPQESGWDFLERLRAQGDETPVIFLTARHQVEERVKGLRLGAEDYVIKPFDFSELLARIEVVGRRRSEPGLLEVGDLRMDLHRRLVEREGVRIEMSPREFEVLHALAAARGQVLSRAELLHSVWGIDFDPGTNLVDVQIARLRRRVDRGGRPLIETVVGQGYRLSVPESSGR